MPSSDPITRYEDIIENIERIERHISDVTEEQFYRDEKTYDAVERCIERICEATVKIGDLARELEPNAAWEKMRGLGNVLRHEYDVVLEDIIWNTATIELPELKAVAEKSIETLKERRARRDRNIDHER